jgi:hypothetical protein
MTKTLLISGCSYSLNYSKIKSELIELFSVDEVINISEGAASPDRQIRGVIEWIAQNHIPDMVILPVTHVDRFDLPIARDCDPLHNFHYKMGWQWVRYDENKVTPKVSKSTIEKYLESGILVNQQETAIHDQLFVKLLTFQSFLKMNNIRHLIFDSANNYKKSWMTYLQDGTGPGGYQLGMMKMNLITKCTGIYKFFDFCANDWIYDSIKDKSNYYLESDRKMLPANLNDTERVVLHYNPKELLDLMKFLKEETGV